MKNSLIILLFLSASCTEKKYSVVIDCMSLTTRKQTQIKKEISASNDTMAFESAVKLYWSHKASIMENNKRLELSIDEPFFFTVYKEDGGVINFSKDISERIAAPTLRYIKETFLPRLDTIIPLSKSPKIESTKIY